MVIEHEGYMCDGEITCYHTLIYGLYYFLSRSDSVTRYYHLKVNVVFGLEKLLGH